MTVTVVEEVKHKACTYKYNCDCGGCVYRAPPPFPSRLRAVREEKIEEVKFVRTEEDSLDGEIPEIRKEFEKVECEKIKERTPEEDILEIEKLLNCDGGELLLREISVGKEKEEVKELIEISKPLVSLLEPQKQLNEAFLPIIVDSALINVASKMLNPETILPLVKVVEKGEEQKLLCEPKTKDKSLANSHFIVEQGGKLSEASVLLPDVPSLMKSGSLDSFGFSFFNCDNEYYFVEFENSHIYNTLFQVIEELEAIGHGAADVSWKSKNFGMHEPDTFPFDNG